MRASSLVPTALLALATSAAAQETHDIRSEIDAPPPAGTVVRIESTRDQVSDTVITRQGQPVQDGTQRNGFHQVYTLEVKALTEDGEAIAEAVRTYETLELLDGEEPRPIDVGGVKVLWTRSEDGGADFESADGSELPKELRKVLELQAGEAGSEEKEEDPMFPEDPVAVGDSWDISVDRLLEDFGIDSETYQSESARHTGTLKKVEEKDGERWAVVDIDIELPLDTFQGMKCPEPLMFRMQGTLRGALGSAPEKSMEFATTMQGDAVPQPGITASYDVSVDIGETWTATE